MTGLVDLHLAPSDLVDFVILGLPFGCVYALLAVGLVLTYKTSGVFNLAYSAQAYVAAAVFYEVRANQQWNLIPAVVFAVFIVSPLIGLLLYGGLFSKLRTAPPIARLVTSLGLLVAIPELVKLWFNDGNTAYGPPGLVPTFNTIRFGEFGIDTDQLATILATVVVAVALTVMFRYSGLGLKMRAVVESPRMAQLSGVDADRISAVSWALSSTLAGLSGVLLAPLFAQVESMQYFTLLVAAMAAAAFGRLSSIPLTFLGGILLGVLQQLIAGNLPTSSVLATGIRPSLPFIVLFLLLLFWPGLRKKETTDPLSGVDPPPPVPAAAIRTKGMTVFTRGLGVAVVVGGVAVSIFVLDPVWLRNVNQGVIVALIFLSITVITGLAGEISLAQSTFAAIGMFTTAQLADNWGLPVLGTIFIGGIVAATVGALLAIPTLRLRGIYFSLATLAFALFFQNVLVPQEWLSGGNVPTKVPRPLVGTIDFADNRWFLLLSVALLALFSVAVILIRRGTTGQFLQALGGSERAATSIGITPTRIKVMAFAVSAGIAGIGGGLMGSFEGRANYESNFNFYFGLVWVVLVVTLGSRSVQAATIAGLSFALVPAILSELDIPQAWAFILFGVGALTYARHPEGVVEANTRSSLAAIQRLFGHREPDPTTPPAPSRPPPPDDGAEAMRTPEPTTTDAGTVP